MRERPSQKLGTAAPSIASARLPWSSQELRNTADTTPAGMPMRSATAIASNDSITLGLACCRMSSVTRMC